MLCSVSIASSYWLCLILYGKKHSNFLSIWHCVPYATSNSTIVFTTSKMISAFIDFHPLPCWIHKKPVFFKLRYHVSHTLWRHWSTTSFDIEIHEELLQHFPGVYKTVTVNGRSDKLLTIITERMLLTLILFICRTHTQSICLCKSDFLLHLQCYNYHSLYCHNASNWKTVYMP